MVPSPLFRLKQDTEEGGQTEFWPGGWAIFSDWRHRLGHASPVLKRFFYSISSNFLSNQVAIERFQGKLGEE